MQRAPFQPQAKSPELFHPRPQHISQVPHLRSPPPPVQPQQQPQVNQYGNPYPPAQPAGNSYGQFGGFFNDPSAQLAGQMGEHALKAGQSYVEQNVQRYVSVSALKHYFNVSNTYVLQKFFVVLFPWRHKPWTRQAARSTTMSTTAADGSIMQQNVSTQFLPPRDDINSPDMYIPIMALITYILLSTTLAGMRGSFRPELLGQITTTAVSVMLLEIAVLKLAMYFLNINNDSQLLDLCAYSGYKFVGVIITLFLAEVFTAGGGTGNWVGWVLFLYTWYANAFFLLRSLKYVLLPDSTTDNSMRGATSLPAARAQKNRRTYFLAVYAFVVQLVFMWLLSREESAVKTVASKISGN